jgi:ferritin-like metal-binding protein YciE
MAGFCSLDELLADELKDIYDAEKQLTKALPKMVKKSTSPELKEAFEKHLQQTEEHVDRLEQAFEELGLPVRGKKCVGMQNLLKEGNEMIGEAENDAVRDAVIIAAAQKVEHYEISSYGTARTWATVLGKEKVASLLEETLEEEKGADAKLTGIAESFVNEEAADEASEMDTESESRESEDQGEMGRRSGGRRGTSPRASRHQAADQETGEKKR